MTNAAIGGLAWLAVGTAAAQPCAGDCAGAGSVAINELILGVSLALGVGEGACAAIAAFVAAPSAAGLETAKAAWLAARPAYLQPEMAHFSDGPIDNADAGIINAPDLYPDAAAALLVEHLTEMRAAWVDGAVVNYRDEFLAATRTRRCAASGRAWGRSAAAR